MNEALLKVEDAALLLKVRRETIRRYIKAGYLKAVTLPGGGYRLYRKDMEQLLTHQKDGSQNAE